MPTLLLCQGTPSLKLLTQTLYDGQCKVLAGFCVARAANDVGDVCARDLLLLHDTKMLRPLCDNTRGSSLPLLAAADESDWQAALQLIYTKGIKRAELFFAMLLAARLEGIPADSAVLQLMM